MYTLIIAVIIAFISYQRGFSDGAEDTINRLKKVPVRK